MNKRVLRIAIHAAELLISILKEILDWLDQVEAQNGADHA